ncbi:FAD-binding oxidoreductase [Acidimicrobiia bacterium]|nr:FAD-binding oxidoreductase [Acidimicrobiia bacterium]
MNNISSWGNIPKYQHKNIFSISDSSIFHENKLTFLSHGLGRSYGDVCLNENENLILTTSNNKILSLNNNSGTLNVESGASIRDVLNVITKSNWFLPVVPGTQNVTIGGAIANDIHGKNHHRFGSFGNHVQSILLMRSDGEVLSCSDTQNRELFFATIGGLGLTGVIISAVIKIIKIKNNYIAGEIKRFKSLEDYSEINSNYDKNYDYTVSWIDCLSKAGQDIRGVYLSGNHSEENLRNKNNTEKRITFPITPPFSLVNNLTMKGLNNFYFSINRERIISKQHYRTFFFPLDTINWWNKAYGKKGFFQYQFVIPKKESSKGLNKILKEIKTNGEIPALGVLKSFGNIKSKGMISFPRDGITMALDFPNKGEETLKFFNKLDKIIMEYGGALYPAKDARMSKEVFETSFPKFDLFSQYIDPRFSSSFYRRIK